MENRRFLVKSYGCQMNVYDSQRIGDALVDIGYSEADDADAAELVILNTCHIREKAAEKIYSELGKLRKVKQARQAEGRRFNIVVAGCVAQAEGEEIIRRQPAVDLVLGPQNYHHIGRNIGALSAEPTGRSGVVDTEFPAESKFDHLPRPERARIVSRGPAAFVTVQEGCDKFCTFCVVPYTRGAEVSRPVSDVIGEISALAGAGVKEVSLLGQNVNAYHGDNGAGGASSLAQMISKVAELGSIHRIRYTTSHPNDMMDDLIELHASEPKLMPYLHLPVQAGSDAILRRMNRQHTAQTYLAIVDRVRARRPDIALSSDFIVGFPGETEEDFAATMALVRQVGFASAYSFKYSPRPGTPGADYANHVPEEVKSRRLAQLQEVLDGQRKDFNRRTVGRKVSVLFEKPGRYPGQIVGKTPYMQTVQVDAPLSLVGEIRTVEITEAGSNSLFGRILEGGDGAGADAA